MTSQEVLSELGIEPSSAATASIEVWNKIDRLPGKSARGSQTCAARSRRTAGRAGLGADRRGHRRARSPRSKTGWPESRPVFDLVLDPARTAPACRWLHRNAEVIEKSVDEDGRVAIRGAGRCRQGRSGAGAVSLPAASGLRAA